MNKVTVEWFWLIFSLLSKRHGRDLHHRTRLDGSHTLMTIVAAEWIYLVFRLYYVLSKSDLYHRTWLEGFHALMNKVALWVILTCISLITNHEWPGLAPSDSPRWLPPIDDHHQHWVILSRISYIIQQTWPGSAPSMVPSTDDRRHGWIYFDYITSYPNLGLAAKALMLWWTKSRLSDFDFHPLITTTNI